MALPELIVVFYKWILIIMTAFNLLLCMLCAAASCIVQFAHAQEEDNNLIEPTTKVYSTKLGATRLVYIETNQGVSVSVSNPQNYPVLIAPKVYAEDRQSKGDYLATPTVFLIEGHEQSRINLRRVGEEYPKDRESLNWLCVKAVPPKNDNAENNIGAQKKISLNVNRTLKTCIQIRFRPVGLKPDIDFDQASITWSKRNGQLIATNNTPYYISLTKLFSDLKNIPNTEYLAPRSELKLAMPQPAGRSLQWSYYNDFGGISGPFQSEIH